MKFLIAALVLLSFTGCTKPSPVGCAVATTISSLVSAQIATQLTCSNLSAIQATVDAQLVTLKICDAAAAAVAPIMAPSGMPVAKPMSTVGAIICAPVIDALANGAVAQIPAAWGCTTGGILTETIKAQILAACIKAI